MIKAFTIIFVATIVIWFLQTFDFKFNVVENSANSMLAALGRLIAPALAPLGFADWRASTALVTGLTAKEAVVSTLSVLMGASGFRRARAHAAPYSPRRPRYRSWCSACCTCRA